MNRVWTALLLLATVVVAGAVVYVLAHNDKVPDAGGTPGYTPEPSTSAPLVTDSPSTSPSGGSGSGSNGPSTSTSTSATKLDTVVFVGDNWTEGVGTTSKTKRFANLIASSLGAKNLLVLAKAGSGYAKSGDEGKNYSDLLDNVVAAKPQLVVVSGGRNDQSDDVNTLTDAAGNLFDDLASKLPDAKIVAVAPFWGDSAAPAALGRVDTAVKDAVTSAGGTYLDITDPLLGHPDWMADEANPNDRGNQAIADALTPKLEALLSS